MVLPELRSGAYDIINKLVCDGVWDVNRLFLFGC